MTQAGATVQVIMSRGASEFVQPLTFQALTYRPVAVEMFGSQDDRAAGHVAMGAQADVVVVAPATANVLARLAAGFADDLIATTVLATAAPVIVAPAMETHMWANAATRDNVARLRARGICVVDPEPGELASGTSGEGRLASLERILDAVDDALARDRSLAGRRVVVTAGPTVEPIDPVRVLTNRSSGKMGYAVAVAAHRAGADVTLITGPTALASPHGVRLMQVETAAQMRDAVISCLPTADAVVMAAAVADYRPAEARPHKVKKRDTGASFTLEMVENADVLRAVVDARRAGTVVVGFKAETGDPTAEAERLLRDKGVDIVVANDVTEAGSEFGSDTDRVSFVARGGVERLELMPKSAVAARLVTRVAELLAR